MSRRNSVGKLSSRLAGCGRISSLVVGQAPLSSAIGAIIGDRLSMLGAVEFGMWLM